MIHTAPLPAIQDLRGLAAVTENYPISGLGLRQYAEHQGFGDDIISFLKLFSDKIVFKNRADFLEHCWLLEQLLKKEDEAEQTALYREEQED